MRPDPLTATRGASGRVFCVSLMAASTLSDRSDLVPKAVLMCSAKFEESQIEGPHVGLHLRRSLSITEASFSLSQDPLWEAPFPFVGGDVR